MDDLKILFDIKCLIVIWRVCDKTFNDRFFMKDEYEFQKPGSLRQTYRAYFLGTHYFFKNELHETTLKSEYFTLKKCIFHSSFE